MKVLFQNSEGIKREIAELNFSILKIDKGAINNGKII